MALCSLRSLAVGWSPLGDHVRLASILSAWFPSLTMIKDARNKPVFGEEIWKSIGERPFGYCATDENEDIHRRWQETAKLVPRYARVRAQERGAGRWVHHEHAYASDSANGSLRTVETLSVA